MHLNAVLQERSSVCCCFFTFSLSNLLQEAHEMELRYLLRRSISAVDFLSIIDVLSPEMDKAREVKRGGGTRFSPAKRHSKTSGHNNKLVFASSNGGEANFSERSKKEKVVRGKTSSSNDDSEMGNGSDGEEEIRLTSSTRRFKIHKKASDDCNNAVDPAAVPRKLRSAMSKRNRESISPPLPDAKKHLHPSDTTRPHVNGAKKSKQNMKQGWLDRPSRKSVAAAITKDEEEVAETLYALARMFPDNKPAKSNGVDNRMAEANSSLLLETRASSVPASEDSEDNDTKLLHVSTGTKAMDFPPREEEQLEQTVKVESAIEHTVLEQPIRSGSQKLDLELNSTAQGDLQRTGLLPKIDNTENMSLSDAMNKLNTIGASSEFHRGNGIVQPTQLKEAVPERKRENGSWPAARKPEDGSWPAADVGMKQEVQPISENTGSGTCLAYMEEGAQKLWPGLPIGSCGGLEHLTRSSSTKAAAGQASATGATEPCSIGNDVSMEKVPPVAVDKRRSWKRCASHVYITHLIRAYQSTEKNSRWPLPASQVSQSKLKEGTKSGITVANDMTAMRNAPNDIIASSTNGSVVERNSHEARIGILNDKRLLPDQQTSTASGMYAQQKQTCNFLSLSAGCESNNSGSNGLESSAQLHVPYLHSLVQHPIMPFSLPHPRFSSPYPDQLAAVATQQVQLQLPPQYLGNPYYGPHLGGHGAPTQQQQMWAAQLAHYRPGGLTVSKWQNGKPESSPSLIPCGSAIIPPSPSSLEVVGGAKYSPNPQQQLFAVTSSSSSRGKRHHHHHHHPSSGYDDGGGGVCSEGSPHLQLLCNAQYM